MKRHVQGPAGEMQPHASSLPAQARAAAAAGTASRGWVPSLEGSARQVAQRRQMEGMGPSGEEAEQKSADGEPVAQAMAGSGRGGLPHGLVQGIQALSGLDLSDVQVHRNSSEPAQLNAVAYAQGADIHLAPGQEQHLPHEAWHVVQQRQGRVQPTAQMAGRDLNDDASLEKEADEMGDKAAGGVAQSRAEPQQRKLDVMGAGGSGAAAPVQRALPPGEPDTQGLYNSTAKGQVYNKGRPVTFSTGFKKNLLLQWQSSGPFGVMHSRAGNKEYVRTVTSKSDVFADWVPIGAFQIDHVYPWDSIEKDLWDRAEGIQSKLDKTYPASSKTPAKGSMLAELSLKPWEDDCYLLDSENDKNYEYFSSVRRGTEKQRYADEVRSGETMVWPTMYAARMYFHEFKNLQPMQGSENAGKGASLGATQKPQLSQSQANVEAYSTRKYLSIMDSVQNAFARYSVKPTKTLYQGLEGAWGAKGAARLALEEAESAAQSSATGAPSTPERVSKMTLDEVGTPPHL